MSTFSNGVELMHNYPGDLGKGGIIGVWHSSASIHKLQPPALEVWRSQHYKLRIGGAFIFRRCEYVIIR